MHSLLIETKKGNIFHTGDWKLDNEPLIGQATDIKRLKQIGKQKVLALIGDSTNILQQHDSISEGKLRCNLETLCCKFNTQLILATIFASNIARLLSFIYIAKKTKRKVILQGKSLWKMYLTAKKAGYLNNTSVYNEKYFKKFKRSEIIVMCTGCQGEELAMTNKIINNKNPYFSLQEGDVAIFSSKIIPGNEKKIHQLFNQLAEINVHTFNETNEFVHVSGHASVIEIKKMLKFIQPKILIPIHGEAIHLNAHCKVAQSIGIKQTLSIRNGDIIIFRNDEAKKMGKVESGYYVIDGNFILDPNSNIIQNRKKIQNNGILFVSIIANLKKKSIDQLYIIAPGVLDDEIESNTLNQIKLNILNTLSTTSIFSIDNISKLIKMLIKKHIAKLTSKDPLIKINVFTS